MDGKRVVLSADRDRVSSVLQLPEANGFDRAG
jgi:hypothetical protein